MKLNVMVNGTPIFMRWKGDISEVRVIPKKEIIIEFNYTKGEVSFLRFIRRIHLTPLGVYVQDSSNLHQRFT